MRNTTAKYRTLNIECKSEGAPSMGFRLRRNDNGFVNVGSGGPKMGGPGFAGMTFMAYQVGHQFELQLTRHLSTGGSGMGYAPYAPVGSPSSVTNVTQACLSSASCCHSGETGIPRAEIRIPFKRHGL